MKRSQLLVLFCLLGLLLIFPLFSPPHLQADAADGWWDEAWPYRIPITVSGSGVAQASINFTAIQRGGKPTYAPPDRFSPAA